MEIFILTTFVFDFAGLRVVGILSKVHGTGHVVINPKGEKVLGSSLRQTAMSHFWRKSYNKNGAMQALDS